MSKHSKAHSDAEVGREDHIDEKSTNGSTMENEISDPATENQEESSAETDVASLHQKYTDMHDKYLRLYSEFDNYRRRVSKEKLEISKTAGEDIISSLLPVMDDFDRAIELLGEDAQSDPMKQGIFLIFNKLRNILNQRGLSEIQALGNAFDTDFHEAIAHVPAPKPQLSGKVIDVTQKGYLLNDKVIRFAKVVVGA